MECFLKWSFLIVQLAALLIAWRDFDKLKRQYGSCYVAWRKVKRHTWKRSVILGALLSMTVILTLPMMIYPFSSGLDHFWDGGLHDAGDYALFALPALAGIIAGGGLVWGRDEGDVVNDKNVGFYMASVVLLLLAHVVYLKMNFRPAVVVSSGLLVSVGATVALWKRAGSEARPPSDQASRLRFKWYELGYALVLIAPPFLLFLIICSLIAFWKGLGLTS